MTIADLVAGAVVASWALVLVLVVVLVALTRNR